MLARNLLAQIDLRKGLPFEVTSRPAAVLSPEQQAAEWQRLSVNTDPKPGEVWYAELGMAEKHSAVNVQSNARNWGMKLIKAI